MRRFPISPLPLLSIFNSFPHREWLQLPALGYGISLKENRSNFLFYHNSSPIPRFRISFRASSFLKLFLLNKIVLFSMISLKIVSEFSVIKGKFSSITLDLLLENLPLRYDSFSIFGVLWFSMADLLHKP